MADHIQPNSPKPSDEIDLGQLFQLIGKGFKRVFRAFLRLFLFFKKNALILIGLVILGAALGYGLNKIGTKRLKTDVIVKPNMESKNYLYNVIDEIQANIKAKDTAFFKNLGINVNNLDGLEVAIAPVDNRGENSESDIKYLELLRSFDKIDAISDIVKGELQNKSSFNHRITFYYKDAAQGQEFAQKILEYINTNTYFDGLIEVYRANATNRIAENKSLLKQVDEIISNYSKKMTQDNALSGNERIVLDNQERINITGLFDLKNDLIRDIESKNIELQQRTDAIKVINFGKAQQVQKSLFGRNIIRLPFILLGLFFLISIIRYLNRKAQEI